MKIKLQRVVNWLAVLVVFLLPLQTIWIIRETSLNGFKWQQGTIGFYATEIVFWLLVLFQVIKWLVEKREISRPQLGWRTVFSSGVLLLAIYVGITVLWSGDSMLAQVMWVKLLEGLLLMMILINNKKNWQNIGLAIMTSGLFQGVLALGQFFHQYIYSNKWLGISEHNPLLGGTYVIEVGVERWLRAYGTLSHPNILGGFLVVTFIFTWMSYFHTPRRLIKVVSLISALIISAGVFVSFSRSAALAYLAAFIWLSIISLRKKVNRAPLYRFWVYILLLLTILTTMYSPLILARVSGSGRLEERSVTERMDLVDDAKTVISNNLMFGTGVGNFTYYIYGQDKLRPGWAYQPVHNVPLLLWGEIGLIGVVLVLVTIISLLVLVIRRKGIMSVSFALLLVLAILATFDHYLWSQYFGLMLVGTVIGFALSE